MADVVLAAVPTPFTADGDLDKDAARRLFGFVAGVVDGLFVAGTTGEFPSLDDDERLALIEIGLDVAGPERVIAHIGRRTPAGPRDSPPPRSPSAPPGSPR